MSVIHITMVKLNHDIITIILHIELKACSSTKIKKNVNLDVVIRNIIVMHTVVY